MIPVVIAESGLLSAGSQAVARDVLTLMAIMTAFVGLGRWIIGAVRKSMSELLDARVRPMEERQARIEAEFRPNGGSSLADRLARVELMVSEMRDRQRWGDGPRPEGVWPHQRLHGHGDEEAV